MKAYLLNAACVAAAVVVLLGIGFSIEWFRRRSVQKWAESQGGSFTAGTILEGTPVPEAAAFDTNMKATYSNVSRIQRPEASYVVAQYHAIWKDFRDRQQSFSCVVCFIDLPKGGFPPVRVGYRSTRPEFVKAILPETPGPAAIPLADATPAFHERFEVLPLSDAGPVKPESLAPLLPRAVQDELVAKGDLISGFSVRGNVIKLEAVQQQFGYSHREVFEVAVRLAAAWAAKP